MFNAKLSKQIFDLLMNGRIINKHNLSNDGSLEENPLFVEIIQNEDDYERQYLMNGYYLDIRDGYIMLRDTQRDHTSLKTDITVKAYLLLLIIFKYLNDHNLRPSKVFPSGSGLNLADIETMEEMEDTAELLDKADLKRSLKIHIKSMLVERNILLEKVGATAYVLSDAGMAFFEEVTHSFGESDDVLPWNSKSS